MKTPGHSPLKTRLAATIGKEAAESVFVACVAAFRSFLEEAMQKHPTVCAYWAVAEQAALVAPIWSGLPAIAQGTGDLGDRLEHVYTALLAAHGAVILVGGDLPHLREDVFSLALEALRDPGAFVMGPARDGGFYLLGGNAPIPIGVWKSTPYSHATTGEILASRLAGIGRVETLPVDFDLDTDEDLADLRQFLRGATVGKEPQHRLRLLKDRLDEIGRPL